MYYRLLGFNDIAVLCVSVLEAWTETTRSMLAVSVVLFVLNKSGHFVFKKSNVYNMNLHECTVTTEKRVSCEGMYAYTY